MFDRVNFLDDFTKDLFLNQENSCSVYRYMSIDKIEPNNLWFTNPTFWKDPFEKLFINSTYKIHGQKLKYKYKNRIFCICVTTNKYSEAAWKVYETDVQFRVSKSCLFEILKKNTDKYDIYVGKVKYFKGTELRKSSPLKLLNLTRDDFEYMESWIKLLLLKRADFSYENEIRIILVERDNKFCEEKQGINLKYDLDFTQLFPRVIIAPDIKRDREVDVINTLLNKFFYSDEMIEKNNLYEEIPPRNINLNYII